MITTTALLIIISILEVTWRHECLQICRVEKYSRHHSFTNICLSCDSKCASQPISAKRHPSFLCVFSRLHDNMYSKWYTPI